MKQTVEALDRFFKGFGWPVWPEDAVDAGERPPYITVQQVDPRWDEIAPFYVRVWDRARSADRIMSKVDEIGAAIGEGVRVRTPSGCVWIHKSTPFAQRQSLSGNPNLFCYYLSLTLQALTD